MQKPIFSATQSRLFRLASSRPVQVTMALSALVLTLSPLRATETDDRIVATAQTSYVFKTLLAEDNIKTASKDGIVTLTGTTADESHKILAADTVSGLPGVTSVDNQIVVKDSPPEHSDTWLFMKVKGTLAYHRSVSAYATKVVLKEGVVTVTGEATSLAEKELVTEYASDVEGVKSVVNNMTIAKTEPKPERSLIQVVDDASISAQVRMALWTHHSTNAIRTTITTNNGAVTIGGVARNQAEKELVTKLVNDIMGVVSVVNGMTIAPATAK